MNKERLLTLADEMEKAGDKLQLDMEQWRDPNCGTVMCAGGFACTIPEFQAEGLRLCPLRENVDGTRLLQAYPVYGSRIEYGALMDFFGLKDMDECFHLFSPFSYPPLDRRSVAAIVRHIRNFVNPASSYELI